MIKIEEYIRRSKEERQLHLKLNEPCVDRGGNCSSLDLKGLLAHVLDTTIPRKQGVLVCHACHNGNIERTD